MDDPWLGQALRRVRLRRDERQLDVARRAGISQAAYSALERGQVAGTSVRVLRAAAAALEIRVELVPRWRGGDLDRLVQGRHSAMSEDLARRLTSTGWLVVPEATFSHFGERGVIDLVAWHESRRVLLLVEIKTEIVNVNALLGTADRRQRLAHVIARDRGWDVESVGSWVVVAESRRNRRHVSAHRALIRAAFPDDGRTATAWARDPVGRSHALWFLTSNTDGAVGRDAAPRKRVSGRRRCTEPRQTA